MRSSLTQSLHISRHLVHTCCLHCNQRKLSAATDRLVPSLGLLILQQDPKHDHRSDEKIINLYETHIPTTNAQKVMLSVGSAIAAITDPYRHDMVAVFGETTGYFALKEMYQNMIQDPEGRQILEDNPRINSKTVDIEWLATLPEGTFGREYYNFLRINVLYQVCNDSYGCNMLGEVVVKWVEAIQTDLPMCWTGGLFGAVRLAPKQRQNYVNTFLPWALRCGHEAIGDYLQMMLFSKL
ncbi:unnamed protein product, partial [Oppiella nova]